MLTKSDLKEIEKIVKPLNQGLGEVKVGLKIVKAIWKKLLKLPVQMLDH